MSRHTWEEVYRYASRHGLDPDDLPSPAELYEDDRETKQRAAERDASDHSPTPNALAGPSHTRRP